MMLLVEQAPGAGEAHLFGWYLGFAIAVVVISVVVALVAPVLVLAARIARQAPQINQALQQSYRNTLPLADLRQTIDHVEVIIGGLQRGRARLGG
jgi:Na+-transporting NADH:ubiquinone oxidoreductase subunit NqrC